MHNFNVLIYNTTTCFGHHRYIIRECSCTKAITRIYYYLQSTKICCDHQCVLYRGEYAHNMHRIYTKYVQNMHTICTQYVQNMHTICIQYAHNMYTICTQYAHNMHKIRTKYVHKMHTICTKYAHNMHTICTQYAHNMHTIRTQKLERPVGRYVRKAHSLF